MNQIVNEFLLGDYKFMPEKLLRQPEFKIVSNIIKINVLTYCLKRRKSTNNKDVKMLKTKNSRLDLLLKCAVCGSKKSRFMKEQ